MLLIIIAIICGGDAVDGSVGWIVGVSRVRIGLVMGVVVPADEGWVGCRFDGHAERFFF